MGIAVKVRMCFFIANLGTSSSTVMDYDLPKSKDQCREKLREEFEKHRNVQDIRTIDMLVIKVRMMLIAIRTFFFS